LRHRYRRSIPVSVIEARMQAPLYSLPVFRVGHRYLSRPSGEASRGAELVAIELPAGIWVSESSAGEILVHSHEYTVGLGLSTALALGLCRLAEQPLGSEAGVLPVG
jgi:hypothetical protein